jgi:hypothetical protein
MDERNKTYSRSFARTVSTKLEVLNGFLVTTACRVLGLRMEERAARYGRLLRVYLISSRGQPARGGPPGWALPVGLTTPQRRK